MQMELNSAKVEISHSSARETINIIRWVDFGSRLAPHRMANGSTRRAIKRILRCARECTFRHPNSERLRRPRLERSQHYA